MRSTLWMFALGVACLLSGHAWAAGPQCPYLPQYQRLQKQIAPLAPEAALSRLYTYSADPENENPAACEAIDIDRAMSEREIALVALSGGGRRLPPRSVFHCDVLDFRTSNCNGIVADGTGQPDTTRILPAGRPTFFSGRIESRLPQARLIGLYRTSLAAVQAGKPPTKITPGGSVSIRPKADGTVLIAIFTAPKPWHYRKVVWYF